MLECELVRGPEASAPPRWLLPHENHPLGQIKSAAGCREETGVPQSVRLHGESARLACLSENVREKVDSRRGGTKGWEETREGLEVEGGEREERGRAQDRSASGLRSAEMLFACTTKEEKEEICGP